MTEENKSVKNFPNLRFPGFEGGWEVRKLGEIAEIKTGNKDTQNKVENGIYPFFVRSNTVERINTYSYDGEAILTSGDGVGVGKNFHYINGRFDFHQRVYSIRNFKDGYDGKYIYSVFSEKFYDRVIRLSAKNSVDSVRMNMISEMKVSFPILNEQQKIASFLTMVGERILTQKKIIEQLETLMKGSRERIFSRKLRFKNENDAFYSEWKSTKLKNITQIFDGTHQTPKYVKNGIPFYSVENLTANNFSVTKSISEDVFIKENNRVKIENGDILMTRIGDIGTVKFIDWDVKASFYVSLALIKKNPNHNSKYLAQYISSQKFQNELWNRTIHVAFPKKINLGEIGECFLQLPCLDEQAKIANFLFSIQEKIEIEKQILEKLEVQKKFLLANLFV